MRNLLQETKMSIFSSGHKIDDIVYIGSEKSGLSCTWSEFVILSNINYDSGCSAPEVCQDLIIVFSDGKKMWRGECCGSEWWEYSKPFVMPVKQQKISTLFVCEGYDNLLEANCQYNKG